MVPGKAMARAFTKLMLFGGGEMGEVRGDLDSGAGRWPIRVIKRGLVEEIIALPHGLQKKVRAEKRVFGE